jgi:hypothetical protein
MDEAHQGIIGVMTGLMMLRQKLGDKGFVQFAAKAIVPKSMGK